MSFLFSRVSNIVRIRDSVEETSEVDEKQKLGSDCSFGNVPEYPTKFRNFDSVMMFATKSE